MHPPSYALYFLLFFRFLPAFFARPTPFAFPTLAPVPLARRDGDVNVQINIDTLTSLSTTTSIQTLTKTVTQTTTADDGDVETLTLTTKVPTVVTKVQTMTVYSTETVRSTVVKSVTSQVTATTTSFDVQVQTNTQHLKLTTTLTQAQVSIVTVDGKPSAKTVYVPITTEEGPEAAKAATQTVTITSNPTSPTSPSSAPTTSSSSPSSSSSSSSASNSAAPTTILPVERGGDSNLNNTNSADSNSTASNANNITISWVQEGNNKYILIGVGATLVVLIIGGVLLAYCRGDSSSSKPTTQTVNVSVPGEKRSYGPAVRKQTYAPVDDVSDSSDAYSDTEAAPVAASARPKKATQ
ncbi:hypothetical protein T439DRAFT_324293 [Meredithblackwellia eburnea MCA 4105]